MADTLNREIDETAANQTKKVITIAQSIEGEVSIGEEVILSYFLFLLLHFLFFFFLVSFSFSLSLSFFSFLFFSCSFSFSLVFSFPILFL